MADDTQDLLLKITGDASGGVSAISDTIGALKTAEQQTEATTAKTSAFGSALGDLKPQTEGAGTAFKSMGEIATEALENPRQAVGRLATGLADDLTPALGGVGIAAGLMAGAVVAGGAAFLELGKQAFELANTTAEAEDHMLDMSVKAGSAVEPFSRLAFAVNDAGGSINMVANAMFVLDRNLGEHADKVEGGLNRIGLSVGDLMALDPADRFKAISQGIADTADSTDRASALSEIFNARMGRELLPTMLKLNAAFEQTKDITPFSAEEAQRAEEFRMAVNRVSLEYERLKQEVGEELIPLFGWFLDHHVIETTIKATVELIDPFGLIGTAVKNQADMAGATADVFGGNVPLPTLPHAPSLALPEAASPVTGGEKQAMSDLTAELKKQEQARKDAQKAIDDYNDALGRVNDAETGAFLLMGQIDAETLKQIQYDLEHKATVADVATTYGLAKDQVQAVKDELAFTNSVTAATTKTFTDHLAIVGLMAPRYSQWHEALTGVSDTTGLLVSSSVPQLTGEYANLGAGTDYASQQTLGLQRALDSLNAEGSITTKVLSGIEGAFETGLDNLPRILEQSFTGGGGMDGAIKAIGVDMGASLGKSIVGAIPGSMTSLLGDKLGGVMDDVLPGIGGALGSLLGKGLDALLHIGGPSKEELAGRKVEGQFEQSLGGLQPMLDAVGRVYEQQHLGSLQAQADVKALFEAEKQGGDAAAAALKKITDVFADQKQDAADLQAAIQRYKFSFEELGPALQRQNLNQQSAQLLNDWRLLVGAGIDIDTVTGRMSGAINDYLHLAIQTGQEVPVQMQPIIQKMIDMGQLTDANGNKITDLKASGITFAETLTQGFDRIIQKFDQLLAGLGLMPDAAAKAAAGIPKNPFADWKPPDIPDGSISHDFPIGEGGFGTAHGGALIRDGAIQRFHDGSPFVTSFGGPRVVRHDFGPLSGDETMAILQDGEGVIQRAAVNQLGPDLIRAVNTGDAARVIAAAMPRVKMPSVSAGTTSAPSGAASSGSNRDLVLMVDRMVLGRVALDSIHIGENRGMFNALVSQAR